VDTLWKKKNVHQKNASILRPNRFIMKF